MNVRENRDELVRRVQIFLGAVNGLLLIVAVGFWLTQIVRGEYYREQAENNRLRTLSLEAPRGLIFDREGRILVENIPSYNLLLDRSRSADVGASLAHAAEILGRPAEELAAIVKRRGGSPFTPLLLAEELTLGEVSRFGVRSLEHPEFDIDIRHQRYYRFGSETAHVLGYLGEANEEDLAANPDLAPGDLVGRKGVEGVYDRLLRGRGGEREVVVDSRGRFLAENRRQPARPGANLTLTLDLELQREAERLLSTRVGAVVALDPRNGEILALASSPSYNPNLFARRLDESQWESLLASPHHPLQNRALQSEYSPGSVFKIVMAVAGLSEGVVTPTERVFCPGEETFYDRRFRCWKRGGHGWMNLEQALEHSCDIYFYHLGQKLGIERIADYSRRFHLGSATAIDLRGERPGLVPDMAWSLARRGHAWYSGETISVAIGQGPIHVTPLQTAILMAAVANGGKLVTPHLLRGADVPPPRDLGFDRPVLERVRRGLWAVVNSPEGTGKNARVPGLEVAGKTGTTQVISQQTRTASETLAPEHRDHAWFGSFAPFEDPSLVIVVFSEHGGKGSTEAAPIARALYERFFRISPVDRGTFGG